MATRRKEQIEKCKKALSNLTFVVKKPQIFFECESGVFTKGAKGDNSSLFYTTDKLRAEVFADILNEWAELKREKKND